MQRENRYTVLKNKDISAYLTDEEQEQLDDLCRKINRSRLLAGKEIMQCVVVEHDWPEHEEVWGMIAARVDAKRPNPAHGAPKPAGHNPVARRRPTTNRPQ